MTGKDDRDESSDNDKDIKQDKDEKANLSDSQSTSESDKPSPDNDTDPEILDGVAASTSITLASLAEELLVLPQSQSKSSASTESSSAVDEEAPTSDDDSNSATENSAPLDLDPLTARSLSALQNLARYGRKHRQYGMTFRDWPSERRAAVMVALFGGRSGELNVLLSTRSPNMRVNPGEVALPGGKMEPSDLDLEYTARREAFEEIGLPISRDSVRHMCTLPPFLSRTSPLLVTPIVCFLLDPSLKPNLNPSEVSNIFSHPLHSFLTDAPPAPHYVPHTVYNGTKPYRLQYDIKWLKDKPYRLFRFEGRLNPIWGFTADILIHVAKIAYGHEPDFERKAPGQLSRRELVRIAVDQLKKGTLPQRPTYPQSMLSDNKPPKEGRKDLKGSKL